MKHIVGHSFIKKIPLKSCCYHHPKQCFLNLNMPTAYLWILLKYRFWFTKPGVGGWDSTFLTTITLSNERWGHRNYLIWRKHYCLTDFTHGRKILLVNLRFKPNKGSKFNHILRILFPSNDCFPSFKMYQQNSARTPIFPYQTKLTCFQKQLSQEGHM